MEIAIPTLIALQQSDPKQFYAELHKSYYRILCAVAFEKVGRSCIAEELVQDVFLKLMKNGNAIEIHNRSALIGFLQTTVNNAAIDLLRSRQMKIESQSCELDEQDQQAPRVCGQSEQALAVQEILSKLPEKQRHVMAMRISGLTLDEVVRLFTDGNRIKPSTIRSTYYRARRSFIKHWSGGGGGGTNQVFQARATL